MIQMAAGDTTVGSTPSCGVLRTCSIAIGPNSLSPPHTGRSSGITGLGRACLPGGWRRTGGSSISPVRSSINSRPRQTISRSAPLACFQSHSSHSFRDNAQRLASGLAAIKRRIDSMSARVKMRPRYFHSMAISIAAVCQRWLRNASFFFGLFHRPPNGRALHRRIAGG